MILQHFAILFGTSYLCKKEAAVTEQALIASATQTLFGKWH
jgi:hypothetical protein